VLLGLRVGLEVIRAAVSEAQGQPGSVGFRARAVCQDMSVGYCNLAELHSQPRRAPSTGDVGWRVLAVKAVYEVYVGAQGERVSALVSRTVMVVC